jgi:imidazolonepropionase-like amidohydrolase
LDIPSEAEAIDTQGKTVLPGIINAHVHQTAYATYRQPFLAQGVTAVCDLGSPLEHIPLFEQDQAQSGPAARGFRAGPIITAPGGYPDALYARSLNYTVTTPDEARAAAVNLLDRGVDVIKIALEPGDLQSPWPMLDLAQVRAVVEQAHGQGTLVRVHIRLETLGIALGAGVDVIEHVPIPTLTQAQVEDFLKDSAPLTSTLSPEYEDLLARMVDHGTILVPTLDMAGKVLCGPIYASEQHRCDDFPLRVVRRFHALGGIVALGNDYPGDGSLERGMPMGEIKALLAAGLSPMEVIEAGTRHAAHVCGHGDELGTLEPSKLADVIIVDGNPLTDIEALSRVVMVIKDGKIVYAYN